MKQIVSSALAGLCAGLIAGALVGISEGTLVWLGSPSVGAWAPLYGTLFYALLVAPAGFGLGLVGGAIAKLRKLSAWTPRFVWTVSLILALLPVALVVARFRIVRDLFHEKLPMASAAGIGVHLGLLVFAAALAGGIWWLSHPDGKGPLAKQKNWAALSGVILAVLVVVSLPFALTAGGDELAELKSTARPESPPVILVMVDTMRADHLTSYGYSKDTAPNLAAFSDDAVQFERAFAQASWTRPSVASLLTSLPPSAHKTMYKPDRLPEDVISVAEVFKQVGYPTGGRVTNYNLAATFNFDQGFDDYRYLTPDYYFFANEGASKLSLYNLARVIREKVAPANDNPASYYQDAQVTTDAALDWIGRHKAAPFFFFLTYMDPHDPYFARPLDGEAWSRAANVNPDPAMAKRFVELYDGEIKYWDEHFGRFIAQLKEMGLYDKAVIVVTSDHGEEFQEHGGWWHGTTLYEEQIHVPLLIKMPGGKYGGTGRDDLAALIDVPPTLIAAAGVQSPESWHGRDLFGKIDAPSAVFSEEDHQGNVLRSLRGTTWKVIEANEDNPRGLAPVELYEISADPGEKSNVAAQEGEIRDRFLGALKQAGEGALRGAVERDQQALDENSRARLEALGYIEKDEEGEPKKEAPEKDGADGKEGAPEQRQPGEGEPKPAGDQAAPGEQAGDAPAPDAPKP